MFIDPWLALFAALLEGFSFDLISNCSNDPPPVQTFTLQDATGLIGGVFNPNHTAALAKLQNVVLRYLWFQYCQCSTGNLTQSLGAPQLPPAGVIVPTGTAGVPCFTGQVSGLPATFAQGTPISQLPNVTSLIVPASTSFITLTDTGGSYNPIAIPSTCTGVAMQEHSSATQFCTGASGGGVTWRAYDINGLQVAQLMDPTQRGAVFDNSQFKTLPATARFWYAVSSYQNAANCGTQTDSYTFNVQGYCGGAAPGSANQYCTTDPAVLQLLSAIWDEVQAIYAAIPTPLRSYAESTIHFPLTGTGSFGVQATALAVKWELTAIPSPIGQRASNPIEYLDVGWIDAITTEGPVVSSRLQHSPQLYALPQLTSTVGYALAPGVVARATELLRGP